MSGRIEPDKLACFQNPLLGPDAWTEVEKKRPTGEGIKAALICRFSCQVRDRCPFGERGTEIIANGGGWFTNGGKFIKPPANMLESNQAAAYIGIPSSYLVRVIRETGIKRFKGPSHLTYLLLEDVERLADTHGPRHGTVLCYNLHLLRGQVPCKECTTAKEGVEVSGARVLRRGVR